MVFELLSNVYERNSVDTINKSTKLYKPARSTSSCTTPSLKT